MEYYWTLFNRGSNFRSSSGTTTLAVSTTTTLNGNSSSIYPWHQYRHPTSDLVPPYSHYTCTPQSSSSADPLTCLKLGKRHYCQKDDEPLAAAADKKTKAHNSARCQVEGCGATLVNAKDYHRRHKVCETHAKSPNVIVHGIRQRFCQQCSRFHSVGEFDDTKRSCRRRLAGHNQRRRKTSQDHTNSRPYAGNRLVRHTDFLNTTHDCALSLLSSYDDNHHHHHLPQSSFDFPARCSAPLREFIAENRVRRQLTQLCPNPTDDHDCYNYDYKLGSFTPAAGWNSGNVTTTTLAHNSGLGLFPAVNDADKNLPSRDDEAAGCSEFWKSIDFL